MQTTNLANRSFWEDLNREVRFVRIYDDHPIRRWIYQHVAPSDGSCIEIGCFPGQYLTIFGDLGFELNGIDQLAATATELPRWLASEGFRVGEFIEDDFVTHDFGARTFDLVYSFGFLEHFLNWDEIIRAHARIVKQGGLLILEAPNFSGFVQHVLHYLFDRPNLARHNVASMHPAKWKEVLLAEGFTVEQAGFFGGFDFWVEDDERGFVQRVLLRIVEAVTRRVRRFVPFNSRHFSPYAGLIARKR